MSGAVLLQPKVRVLWGTIDLTCPAASETPIFEGIDLTDIGPLVYDVRVSLEDQGQTPSGSMRWNPSGLAFQVYEKCLQKFIDYSITVQFYYPGISTADIAFTFYWGGQTETVGIDMDMTVKLVSLFDGLISANFYSFVQANKDEKPVSLNDASLDLIKKFGIYSIYEKEIEIVSVGAEIHALFESTLVKNNYSDGSTFMEALQNIYKVAGLNLFFSNATIPGIYRGAPNRIFAYGPYSRFKAEGHDKDVRSTGVRRRFPVLSPGMFQNFTRNYEWQPPQKSQEISSIISRKVEAAREAKLAAEGKTRRTVSENSQDTSGKEATLPEGVYQGKATNGASIFQKGNLDYEYAARNQDLFNKEKAAKLSFTTFCFPRLTGILPLNILPIFSGDGSFIEDWIVSSVEYQQTQGGVDVSIQATRMFGKSGLMNEEYSDIYLKMAKQYYPRATDEELLRVIWMVNYRGTSPSVTIPPSAQSSPPSTPKPDTSPEDDPRLGEVREDLRKYIRHSNKEFRKVIEDEWKLPPGKPEYTYYSVDGKPRAKVEDPLLYAYIRYYYGVEKPNPEVNGRIISGIQSAPPLTINDFPVTYIKEAQQSYVNGGKEKMLNYYEKGAVGSMFKFFVSINQSSLFPDVYKPYAERSSTTVVQPLPQTPQTPQIAPTSTSALSTTAQPNARDYQSPPEQSGPETLQPRGREVIRDSTELTPQPPKPAERPLDLTAAAEARKRLDLAFPVPKSPAIGSDGRVNDPLFYVALPEMIKTSSNPELDKSIKFLGNYRLANYSLERIQFWYQVWTTNKKPGREIYLDILQKRGEKAVNEVYIKAKSGG